MARLGDICAKGSSAVAQKDLENNDGIYPIYGAGGFIKSVNFYHQEKPYVAVVKDGAGVGRVMKLPANSSVIGTMQYIIPNEGVNVSYLAYALEHINLSKYYLGAAIPHIYFKDYCNEVLPDHTVPEQEHIAATLDMVAEMVSLRKQQLAKLDELVKARFVELFGDPETNPNGWEKVTVGDVCSSIVRGPFGSALKKDFFVEPSDTTYKVYEQKHAIQKSATIGTYYVTEEKYQELKRFECVSGDILMSCSGTMGELYQLPEGCERGIINQALCKFTLNDKMLPICFLTYMEQTIGNLETKGSGIKNIAAVSYVKAMPINLPPMSVQLEFENFCKQTDKSKLVIQQSLDKLETLKKSLMQKYFG